MRMNAYVLKYGLNQRFGWQQPGLAAIVLLASIVAGIGVGSIIGADERTLWPLLCVALLALLGGIGLTGTP